jgi:hypothetical protein
MQQGWYQVGRPQQWAVAELAQLVAAHIVLAHLLGVRPELVDFTGDVFNSNASISKWCHLKI